MLTLCILFGSVSAYAMSEGLTVAGLFERMWSTKGATKQFEKLSGITNLKEKSDYEQINVTAVKAISDGYKTYAVLKVTMKDGSDVPKDMGFTAFLMHLGKKDKTKQQGAYLIKSEKKAFYFAFVAQNIEPYERDEATIHLKVSSTCYTTYEKDGREKSIDSYVDKKDKHLMHYRIREDGKYTATMKCKINKDSVTTKLGEELEAKITPLEVILETKSEKGNKMIDKMGLTGYPDMYLILSDGRKIRVRDDMGSSAYWHGENAEPVVVDEVEKIEVLGREYQVKGQKDK